MIGVSPVLDPLMGQELGRVTGFQLGLKGAELATTSDGRSVCGIQTRASGVLKLRQVTLLRNSKGTIFGRERLSVEDFQSASSPLIRPDTGSVLLGLNGYTASGSVVVRAPSPVADFFGNTPPTRWPAA